MDSQKLHFFAPLGNVDDSISKLKLKQGFQIDSMSYDGGCTFISQLEKFPQENIGQWRHIQTVFPQGRLFFIKNSFDFDLPKDEKGYPVFTHELYKFSYDLVDKNIDIPLRLLRLYKEGNVHLPCWYIYSLNNEIPSVILASGTPIPQSQDLFHLDDSEIKNVQEFLETTKIPFNFDYLKLAHDNYELSYTVHDSSLSFLSLMIALEVLFTPGQGRSISKTISRNIAFLLGNSIDEIRIIKKEIRDLYTKRSDLVHSGKIIWAFIGEDDDLSKIRKYVRESLKKIILLNLPKDDLLDLLEAKSDGKLDS
jgi:hypothetical protein